MRTSRLPSAFVLSALLLTACTGAPGGDHASAEAAATAPAKPKPKPKPKPPPEPEPAQMEKPVPLWKDGKVARQVDAVGAAAHGYVVIDLGEEWTPYLFTDGVDEEGNPLPNAYRKTYLALARGDYPDDYHGERARDDKYLELYGIMPTVSLMRKRFRETAKLPCATDLDLTPLVDYKGLVTYTSNDKARKESGDFVYLRNQVKRMMRSQKVDDPEALDIEKLDDRDVDRLKRFNRKKDDWYAVAAMQDRLRCEGFLKGRGRITRGALDWPTHDALAEFERRHRVYSWGYMGKDTLAVLRITPMEAEREAVVRVLLERAIHAAQILEDGSTGTLSNGEPRTFEGADGEQHPVPNLVGELEERLVKALGLQTPESTLAWLEELGELPADEEHLIAIEGPELPEYYDGDMKLTLDYDRGDVWYDFPFDAEGKELAQPVSRRPKVTVSTFYNGQKIRLARYGTTIGGWRSELIGETVMWKYKESPPGPRVWERIVASPVWLPPDGTPPRDILKRKAKRKPNEPKWEINYHETGPSYASAYGLVAAYHRKFVERADGTIDVGGDEGIRTHGSVDYMSIMRRHSHGCHRLHNHIAVRLMSFVLAHRPHKRIGQQPLAFKKEFEYEDEKYLMDLSTGGYIFELDTPLQVQVLEGRIRGKLKEPIAFAVPKYDEEVGAYLHPDGGAVEVRGDQLVDVPMPVRDAGTGILDGLFGPGGVLPLGPRAPTKPES